KRKKRLYNSAELAENRIEGKKSQDKRYALKYIALKKGVAMTIDTQNINQVIKEVYNGTINAVKKVIPLEPNIGAPQLINPPLKVEFGVTIGFTGDLKGELVLQAEKGFMSEIG